jgi:hypothetical protein
MLICSQKTKLNSTKNLPSIIAGGPRAEVTRRCGRIGSTSRSEHWLRQRIKLAMSCSGAHTFIGHPKGDHAGKVLVLAHSGEVGVEIDADECSPSGRGNPQRGRAYRQRYFRNHPRGLEGNP